MRRKFTYPAVVEHYLPPSSLSKVSASYQKALRAGQTPDGSPVPISRQLELSWCGGFVDGEGCISAVWQRFAKIGRRPTMRIRMYLTQNCLQSLQQLARILGGEDKIYSITRYVENNKPMYTLALDGARAVAAVAKLQPYLIRKKYEADYLLAAVERCWLGHRPGPKGYPAHVWAAREQLVKKLQRLK